MSGPMAQVRPDPIYRYIFEDTLTGIKLQTIPMYGVNLKRYLATWGQSSTYGTFTGTFRADTPGFEVQDLLDATIPGRTNVWVERDGVLIWGGQVTTRTYQSQAYTYQIDATTFDGFMQGQFETLDKTSTTDDPRNLIIQLWTALQSQNATNLRLVLPGVVTGQTPLYTFSWIGTDFDAQSDLISAAIQAGAEYRIDFAYDQFGNRTATLTVGRWDQPVNSGMAVGADPDEAAVTFRYPGGISNYWISESGPQGATQVLGIGQSSTTTTPRGALTNSDMISQGWPLYGIKFNWTNVTDQSSLSQMLVTSLQQFAPPFITPTYKLNGSSEYGKFNLGDYLHVVVTDRFRFPAGPFKQDIRVVAMELSPTSDDGVETADFTVDQPSTTG